MLKITGDWHRRGVRPLHIANSETGISIVNQQDDYGTSSAPASENQMCKENCQI